MTEASYDDCVEWLRTAGPGERIIYHTGSLAFGRAASPGLDMIASLFLGAAGYRLIPVLGPLRWTCTEEPRCILVQRKATTVGPTGWPIYEYIAIKR